MSQNILLNSKSNALTRPNLLTGAAVVELPLEPLELNGRSTVPAEELLSALVDGQLSVNDFAAVSDFCRQDLALEHWNSYHLIGDVLRSSGTPVRTVNNAFLTRLNAQLAKESILEVPEVRKAPESVISVTSKDKIGHDAANDSVFRWKLIAGLASLFAVTAIVWSSTGFSAANLESGSQLAQANTAQPVVVASPQGPVVRDARLEELLAAHRQLGGTSLLEIPSGFLRNANYETPQTAGR